MKTPQEKDALKRHLSDYFQPLASYPVSFDNEEKDSAPLWLYRLYALEANETLFAIARLIQGPPHEANDEAPWRWIAEEVLATQGSDDARRVDLHQNTPATWRRLLTLCQSPPSSPHRGLAYPAPWENTNVAPATQEETLLKTYAQSLLVTRFLRSEHPWRQKAMALLREEAVTVTVEGTSYTVQLATPLSPRSVFMELAYSDFSGLDLSGLDFSSQHLKGILADRGTQACRTRFRGACLHEARLTGGVFTRADFTGADVSNSHLSATQCEGAIWKNANLSHAAFSEEGKQDVEANCREGHFNGANLSHARLTRTCFDNAVFEGAVFHGATVGNTSFKRASFSDTTALEDILVLDATTRTNLTLSSYLNAQAEAHPSEEAPRYALSKPRHLDTPLAIERHIDALNRLAPSQPTRSLLWPKAQDNTWQTTWQKTRLDKARVSRLSPEDPLFAALSYFVHLSSEAKGCQGPMSLTRVLHGCREEGAARLGKVLWQEYRHRPTHQNYVGRVRIEGIDVMDNPQLWRAYQTEKETLRAMLQSRHEEEPLAHVRWHGGQGLGRLPVLDREVGECWLFHATGSLEVMHSIMENGFTTKYYSGAGRLGKGVYLTDAFGKSATYVSWNVSKAPVAQAREEKKPPLKALFLVRAVLGRTYCSLRRRGGKKERLPEGYTAVWAPDGQLNDMASDFRCNEFLVGYRLRDMDDRVAQPVTQLYPEYCILYREFPVVERPLNALPLNVKVKKKNALIKAPRIQSTALLNACQWLYDYERVKTTATALERAWVFEKLEGAIEALQQKGTKTRNASEAELSAYLTGYVQTVLKNEHENERENERGQGGRAEKARQDEGKGKNNKNDKHAYHPNPEVMCARYARCAWDERNGLREKERHAQWMAYYTWFDAQLKPRLMKKDKAVMTRAECERVAIQYSDAAMAALVTFDTQAGLRFFNEAWYWSPKGTEARLRKGLVSGEKAYTLEAYYRSSLVALTQGEVFERGHEDWVSRVAHGLSERLMAALQPCHGDEGALWHTYITEWESPVLALAGPTQRVFITTLARRLEAGQKDQDAAFAALSRRLLADVMRLPSDSGQCLARQARQDAWENILLSLGSEIETGESDETEEEKANEKGKRQAENPTRLGWVNDAGLWQERRLHAPLATRLGSSLHAASTLSPSSPRLPCLALREAKREERKESEASTEKEKARQNTPTTRFTVEDSTPSSDIWVWRHDARPGLQYAVNDLLGRLTGYGAQTTACWLYGDHSAHSAHAPDTTPVNIYLTLAGETRLLAKNPLPWMALENALDRYDFTLLWLGSLVLGLGDQDEVYYTERTSRHRLRVVALSTPNAFRLNDTTTPGTTLHPFNVLSLLMQSPLDPRAVRRFLQLSPEDTLVDWLTQCSAYTNACPAAKEEHQSLFFHLRDTISPRLKARWTRLADWLHQDEHQNASHAWVLEDVFQGQNALRMNELPQKEEDAMVTPAEGGQKTLALCQRIREAAVQVKANQAQSLRLAERMSTVEKVIRRMLARLESTAPAVIQQKETYGRHVYKLNQTLEEVLQWIHEFSQPRWYQKILPGVFAQGDAFWERYARLEKDLAPLSEAVNETLLHNRHEDQRDREKDYADLLAKREEIIAENQKLKEAIQRLEMDAQHQEDVLKKQAQSIAYYLEQQKPGKKGKSPIPLTLQVPFYELNIARLLAEGSFGKVYQGHWLGQEVAIKVLEGELTEAERKEFIIEVNVMKRLRSEHVMQLIAVCDEPGRACLIMKYMTKGSLRGVLDKKEPLTPKACHRLILDIALGLYYLHYQNIIHRDLKSANILLDESYRARVADFGLSKLASNKLSTLGKATQDVNWVAPEVIRGTDDNQGFTKASDVYSFGMVVWEVLTGNVPYEELSYLEVVQKIAKEEQEVIPASLPSFYRELIQDCWQLDRLKRPTIEMLVNRLRNYVVPEPVVEERPQALRQPPAQNPHPIGFWSNPARDGEASHGVTPKALLITFMLKAAEKYESEKNDKEAMRWYKKAAMLGIANEEAPPFTQDTLPPFLAYKAAEQYEVEKKMDEAIAAYRWAGTQGYVNAFTNLAMLYLKEGPFCDKEKAHQLLLQAAEGGHVRAMRCVAYQLEKGDGIPANRQAAILWYQKAADKGESYAKEKLQQLQCAAPLGMKK